MRGLPGPSVQGIMGPVETRNILSLAIDLELKTSECYARIARMPGAAPFADDLMKLAKEEIVHANLLRSGKDYESSNPEAFGGTFITQETLEEELKAADDLLSDMDSGKLTLVEAIGHIRDLEVRFEQAHLSTLVEIKDPHLQKLFRALSAEDAGHKLRLQSILRDL